MWKVECLEFWVMVSASSPNPMVSTINIWGAIIELRIRGTGRTECFPFFCQGIGIHPYLIEVLRFVDRYPSTGVSVADNRNEWPTLPNRGVGRQQSLYQLLTSNHRHLNKKKGFLFIYRSVKYRSIEDKVEPRRIKRIKLSQAYNIFIAGLR